LCFGSCIGVIFGEAADALMDLDGVEAAEDEAGEDGMVMTCGG